MSRIDSGDENKLEGFGIPYECRICKQFLVHPNDKCNYQAFRELKDTLCKE